MKMALEFLNDNKPTMHKDDVYEIRLVLDELLTNAVVHGNKEDEDKNVYFQMQLRDDSVTGRIIDEGKGFDYMKFISEYDKNHMKENGRGIKLACELTDSIAFNCLGNEIKFFKKVY